jgi:hypothetical protein
MEIHAPEAPIRGAKDFFVHISIVTIGILIALGLDGLREMLRERHLVRETRANFHHEFEGNRQDAGRELSQILLARDKLASILKAMPDLALQHPEDLAHQLSQLNNPYYFFAANSWQAALSTGVLAHMSPEEVAAYASATEAVRRYTQVQTGALDAETHALAIVHAHPHPTVADVAEENAALFSLYRNELIMVSVCPQMQKDIESALRASTP